jgi:catechol 2,3-dioxygenase-like lactoylglutathione lyase family enzyme
VRPEFRFYFFTPLYDETVAFYRDVLGLQVYRSWDREDGDRGTIFIAPNAPGLIEIEAGPQLPSINGGFYIEVPDLERWYDRVREAGAPIVKALGVTSYGHENFRTHDPSGVEVTFFRYAVDPP